MELALILTDCQENCSSPSDLPTDCQGKCSSPSDLPTDCQGKSSSSSVLPTDCPGKSSSSSDLPRYYHDKYSTHQTYQETAMISTLPLKEQLVISPTSRLSWAVWFFDHFISGTDWITNVVKSSDVCKSKYIIICVTTINIVTATAKIGNKTVTQQTEDFSKAV